eukprot:CAMPEP_0169166114 /NCGR_PEP_ID=MMETSP1015-20121227/59770_1 /TAXON_ID=342587 /ORGANISM="Karlodinium micrum, Strain CCMP2283" /LENGTH=165 /DNA_ID=CAMNT_0009238745 /DNA_START=900 /DNA_END=1397 /DNA_ORIENTATION=+
MAFTLVTGGSSSAPPFFFEPLCLPRLLSATGFRLAASHTSVKGGIATPSTGGSCASSSGASSSAVFCRSASPESEPEAFSLASEADSLAASTAAGFSSTASFSSSSIVDPTTVASHGPSVSFTFFKAVVSSSTALSLVSAAPSRATALAAVGAGMASPALCKVRR